MHELPYYIFYLRSTERQRSSDSTHVQAAHCCPDLDKELHGQPSFTQASYRTAFTHEDGDLHPLSNFQHMSHIDGAFVAAIARSE